MFRFLCTLSILFSLQAFGDVARFHQVSQDVYRGGQPTEEQDFQTLHGLGIKTVISLMSDQEFNGSFKYSIKEEQWIVEKTGMKFMHLPLRAMYPLDSPDEGSVNKALEYMTDPEFTPVYVHCIHGKDRTGLIIGLYRVLYEGWTPKDAYKEMRNIGFTPYFFNYKKYFFDHANQN